MNTNLPLEELILTLLALAEAAPHLDEGARVALAEVAQELREGRKELSEGNEAGYVDLLSLAQMDIVTELYGNATFQAAKTAWNQQLTIRVGMDTTNEWGAHTNPMQSISPTIARSIPAEQAPPPQTFLQRLVQIVLTTLDSPTAFAQDDQTRKELASRIGLPWPK